MKNTGQAGFGLGWLTGSTGFRLVAGGNFEAVAQVPRTFILIQVLAKLDGITGVCFLQSYG